MKTHFKFSLLLLLIAFLFGACSSSLGFSKRRYNKGYHVSIIKDRHSIPNKNAVTHPNRALTSVASKLELTTPSPAPNDDAAAAPTYHRKSFEKIQKFLPVNFGKKLHFQNSQFADLFSRSKHSQSENPTGFLATDEERKINSKNYNDGRSFSLLWIAVVLILFLWYLGFLAGWGSGGIINLLLIIAFILLVLWLLRIL